MPECPRCAGEYSLPCPFGEGLLPGEGRLRGSSPLPSCVLGGSTGELHSPCLPAETTATAEVGVEWFLAMRLPVPAGTLTSAGGTWCLP